MAADSSALVQALIDGGISPAASRVIANALANAATPQFSRSRDVSDATPRDQLRMIDGDTRKYLLTNLDYSTEAPYQNRLQSHPGRYAGTQPDHPYKDSQPVAPVPPLSQNAVAAGDYIVVDNTVLDNAPVATVSLKLGNKSGTHLRISPSTKSVDAIPLVIASPQGLVTGSINEGSTATTLELVVRQLATMGVVLNDGTVANVLGWQDSATSLPYRWVVPPGAVMPFAKTLSTPQGWLLCDGTSYSKSIYADLFTAIGYSYGGSGDNFNVPDLRGYFVRGHGTNSDNTASGTLGVRQGQATAMPSLPFSGTTATAGAHAHSMNVSYTASGQGFAYESGQNNNEPDGLVTKSAGDHAHFFTITGGGDIETRPKNIALPYYIKT